MPASFADQPRRDAPVEGRRGDDGLDLVEAITGAAALAAIAELAPGDGPAREDIVGVSEEDVVATQDDDGGQPEGDGAEEED